MMITEKQRTKLLLIKFGAALALSFAGFLYSRRRTKRIKPPPQLLPSLPPSPSSGCSRQFDSQGRAEIKDDSHGSQKMPICRDVSSAPTDAYEKPCIRVNVDNFSANPSSSIMHHGDKDGLLLPEFIDLVKEFDMDAAGSMSFQRRDLETSKSTGKTLKTSNSVDRDEYEQEIRNLKNMVGLLRERERYLEIQLLEYYGLREQETAVMELQNRLKISSMEAKLFSLRIESLQTDNRHLEAQVSEYSRVMAELEAAKAKIKVLKKKLRSEAEQNKEQILNLKHRVAKLQEHEHDKDADIQSKLQRLTELEVEYEELRKSNFNLQLEHSELADRLESTQLLATSMLEDSETEELRKDVAQIRQENENLAKEVERLQADRCTDAEELVYLRWINACLRHELKNYKPPPGKTIARDLSRSLSPRSEEKAKQLILKYAGTQGTGEAGISIVDFDSDLWSSSQSYHTDSPDSTSDHSSASKTRNLSKTRFFSKLRRLIRGKDNNHQDQHNRLHQRKSSLIPRARSVDDFARSRSCDYSQGSSSTERTGEPRSPRNMTPSHSSNRESVEVGRLTNLIEEDTKYIESVSRSSDSGSSHSFKQFVIDGESTNSSPQEDQADKFSDGSQKSELAKYAEALRDSPWSRRARWRAASVGHA
ncbi:hypothetical protein Ancab_012290 [Ancistrocladus abbreviatus]